MIVVLGLLSVFSTAYYLARGLTLTIEIGMDVWVFIMNRRRRPRLSNWHWRVVKRVIGVGWAGRDVSTELALVYLLTLPYQVWTVIVPEHALLGRTWYTFIVCFWVYDAWMLIKNDRNGRWKKRGKKALARVRAVGAKLVVVPVSQKG